MASASLQQYLWLLKESTKTPQSILFVDTKLWGWGSGAVIFCLHVLKIHTNQHLHLHTHIKTEKSGEEHITLIQVLHSVTKMLYTCLVSL